jgi:hypothetical protein
LLAIEALIKKSKLHLPEYARSHVIGRGKRPQAGTGMSAAKMPILVRRASSDDSIIDKTTGIYDIKISELIDRTEDLDLGVDWGLVS